MYKYQEKDFKFHKDKMNFVSRIFPREKGSVLDIGCHTGELGFFLNEKGYSYYGIDIDEKLIKKAKERRLNVRYCDIDHNKIPFNKKFDYVTILDLLEHIHDPEIVINEIKSHLNQSAKIIISLPNDFHFLNRIRFLLGHPIYPDPFWAHTHLHTFTKKQAKAFLKEQSLEILAEYEIPGTFPWFLSFNKKRILSIIFPAFFSRSTIYICKLK